MILCAQTLRAMTPQPVFPFVERTVFDECRLGPMTYGLGPAGYDVRVEFDAEGTRPWAEMGPGDFLLASTVERFTMPNDVIAFVHDKSSWARRGIAVQNTVIEPGWCGYLTLELTNHSRQFLKILRGAPIAQIVFQRLDCPTTIAYTGKYQNQGRGPKTAR